MSMLERAIAIAAGAHEGQLDKAGEPYVLHPLRVMLRLKTTEEKIAGVLHDVIEDTSLTMDDLRAEGFSEVVLRAIDAVTRRDGEGYEEFVRRAAADEIGRAVKLADLHDNADLSRISNPTAKDQERVAKYRRAIAIIESLASTPSVRSEEQAPASVLPKDVDTEGETKAETAFVCSICGNEAGHIVLLRTAGGERLIRRSFTGTMESRLVPPGAREAIDRRDARELHRLDFELAPFYCPQCDASFCGDHWTVWDVFDEDVPSYRDSIRGSCPKRHTRMLED